MPSSHTISETQKAWITVRKGAPSTSLEFRTDWPVKKILAPGEVLVKVHAAALNPLGYKLMGMLPDFLVKRPYVPEYDFSGTVISIGTSGSGEFKEGDEVLGWIGPAYQRTTKQGALSEYIAIAEEAIVKRPSNLSEIEAAGAIVSAMAALQALDLAKLEEGQTVFINGGSTAVGSYAIQLAKLRGAKVVVTASERNEEHVKRLGADEFIDYTKVGPLHMYLHDNPPRTKYNVILEAVGWLDPSFYTHSARYLASNGIFVTVGLWPQGSIFKTVSQGLRLAGAKVFPSFLTGIRSQHKMLMASDSKEDLLRLAQWLEEGKLKPTVDSVYAFDEVLKAYERLMSSRARGKVVVNVSLASPTTTTT